MLQQLDRKQIKSDARASMVNPFKLGQIFYDSWGYEQTNIDFYQVVEVKPKSVKLQRIKGEVIPEAGFQSMSAKIRPLKNQFEQGSQPFLKPVCVLVKQHGAIEYFLRSKHGWMSIYDKGDKGCYFSWYA